MERLTKQMIENAYEKYKQDSPENKRDYVSFLEQSIIEFVDNYFSPTDVEKLWEIAKDNTDMTFIEYLQNLQKNESE